MYAALSLYGRKQPIIWTGFSINVFTWGIGLHARARQMLTARPGEDRLENLNLQFPALRGGSA
jgi:hypothetical protein